MAFAASPADLAAALMHLRTATRVLVRIVQFRATSFAQLERAAAKIAWGAWVHPGARVRFRVTCKKSRLYHSDAVAERLATAIRGAVRDVAIVARASDDDDAGDQQTQLFIVRMADDECTISADAAGEALHRRGYRQATAKAPLRETLAAAMLLAAGYDGSLAMYDPFCGSGTIVVEAALIARRIAPGLHRSFAAEAWPGADARAWRAARADANARVLAQAAAPIAGSDRDVGAIAAAQSNAERAGVAADVAFTVAPVSVAVAPAPAGLLVTNPPYGVRTGDRATLRNLYARFGAVARSAFAGWTCALLSADRTPGHDLERQLGLALTPRWRSTNGGIPVRLLAGEISAQRRRTR